MKSMHGHRGGLSTLVSTLVLIVLVVGGLVGIALYYSTIASGAVSQPHLVFAGSLIKVDASDGSGYVYVRIYNEGPGAIRISQIAIDNALWVDFSWANATTAFAVKGNPGTGVFANNLVIPAGATVSVACSYAAGTIPYQPGTVYAGLVVPTDAAEQPFTIPSESAP